MKRLQSLLLLLLCYKIVWVTAQLRIKEICVTSDFEEQCNRLERETQEIRCVRVEDSLECAKKLQSGTSGFGIFSAESTLLFAALNYNTLTVLKELRHRDRQAYLADFESVVIVKADFKYGIEGLNGLNYCHPGLYYDHTERWSEQFLKEFERSVTTPTCDNKLSSAAEIEVDTLAKHFKSACRPGVWSNNPKEDQRLKKKYPQLCELCNSPYSPCEYTDKNRHIGALRCLIDKGGVAYASLQDTQNFFAPTSEFSYLKSQYAYLCRNGSIQLMTDHSREPCTWLRQPWPVIISNGEDSIKMKMSVNKWIYGTSSWEMAIKDILTSNSLTPYEDSSVSTSIQSPRDFFSPFRRVPFSQPLCSTEAKWCTKSYEEKEKCEIVRTAGVTTGIFPTIKCNEPVAGAITCLREINDGRADFTTIDSNLGYIARNVYNLTTALYGETVKKSAAVVVVRANSTYKNFEDLRNKKACIAENDGIASVSFIIIGKTLGFLSKNHCNHSRLLSEFFESSCVPGASDSVHGVNAFGNNLCSLCPPAGSGIISAVHQTFTTIISGQKVIPLDHEVKLTTSSLQNELDVMNNKNNEIKLNCNADHTNGFYGDLGALFCLHTKGDVAILGLKDLNENAKALGIRPDEYKIICKNGSLAMYTGFDVDSNCPLASFIDNEIVVKPNNNKTNGIINALISFDKYFKVDPDFKIYGNFNGQKNVLFNSGTTGFILHDENDLGEAVNNYNNLFKSLDACGSAFKFIPTTIFMILTVFFTLFISRLLQ